MIEINISITRKCDVCKNNVEINNNNFKQFILYDSKTYDLDCFLDMLNKKIESKDKRVKKDKWIDAQNNIEHIKKESYESFHNRLLEQEIYQFIIDKYDTKIVEHKIFEKLASMYDGSYKGLTVPILREHLLDMWQQKIGYLNKVYAQNKAKGKFQNDVNARINYDLSILINKYDSYLKWLEQQKVNRIEQEINNNDTMNNSDINRLYNSTKANTNTNTNTNTKPQNDIEDILDEVFG